VEPLTPGPNRVTGVVKEIGYLGDVSIYHVRLPNGKVVQAQVTNRERLTQGRVTWDQQVYLSWEPSSGIVLSI
jgi:putrescine transport system ATP-binding protein